MRPNSGQEMLAIFVRYPSRAWLVRYAPIRWGDMSYTLTGDLVLLVVLFQVVCVERLHLLQVY